MSSRVTLSLLVGEDVCRSSVTTARSQTKAGDENQSQAAAQGGEASRSDNGGRDTRKCFKCQKIGHITRNCRPAVVAQTLLADEKEDEPMKGARLFFSGKATNNAGSVAEEASVSLDVTDMGFNKELCAVYTCVSMGMGSDMAAWH